MSNKTDLQTLNAKYESLVEELKGKAVGGGSGGSVKTCTVTIQPFEWDVDHEDLIYISAPVIEDENRSIYTEYNPYDIGKITLTNVLCDSYITIMLRLYSLYPPYIEIEGSMELLKTQNMLSADADVPMYNPEWIVTLSTPTIAGEHAVLNFSYEP